MGSMCKVILLTFFLTLAVLIGPPASAQPRCQKSDVWANGKPAALNSIARRHARAAWSARVRSEVSEAYATWSRSGDRRTSCFREQRKYRCTVSARPCRAYTAFRHGRPGLCRAWDDDQRASRSAPRPNAIRADVMLPTTNYVGAACFCGLSAFRTHN